MVLSNFHSWGWITLVLGIVEVTAGLSLFVGGVYGRAIGIAAASLGAAGALLGGTRAYPFWSLGVFVLCLIVVHGLVVYGEPREGTAPRA